MSILQWLLAGAAVVLGLYVVAGIAGFVIGLATTNENEDYF